MKRKIIRSIKYIHALLMVLCLLISSCGGGGGGGVVPAGGGSSGTSGILSGGNSAKDIINNILNPNGQGSGQGHIVTQVIFGETGTISGYVSGPVGQVSDKATETYAPIQNADVTAICGDTVKTTKTNAEGYYKIENLPAGTCTITASKDG